MKLVKIKRRKLKIDNLLELIECYFKNLQIEEYNKESPTQLGWRYEMTNTQIDEATNRLADIASMVCPDEDNSYQTIYGATFSNYSVFEDFVSRFRQWPDMYDVKVPPTEQELKQAIKSYESDLKQVSLDGRYPSVPHEFLCDFYYNVKERYNNGGLNAAQIKIVEMIPNWSKA